MASSPSSLGIKSKTTWGILDSRFIEDLRMHAGFGIQGLGLWVSDVASGVESRVQGGCRADAAQIDPDEFGQETQRGRPSPQNRSDKPSWQ